MKVIQRTGAVVLLCCSLLASNAEAQEPSSNSSTRLNGIDLRNRPEVPSSILRLYNIYGRPPHEIRLRQEPSQQDNQQSDPQSSNADNNQESLADNPSNGPQTQNSPKSNQGSQDIPTPPALGPQFNFGPGQFPQHFQGGFNFGVPPGQFNFQYSPPVFNQNANTQQSSNIPEGQNFYAQNFPPFNFRTGTQLTNQINSGQNGNGATNTPSQQNNGLYTGANINPLPVPPVQQQIPNYDQFSGFPLNTPNFSQNFQQQFVTPNFGTGGFSNNSGQLSTGSPSDDAQRSVVGFYGGAPNIGGYTFNTPGLQSQQQQAISGPGGYFGPGFGQYLNGVPQLNNVGVDQIGNNFARFAYNPAAFQTGGLSSQPGFNSNFSTQQTSQLPAIQGK